ncbi:MAG: sigma-70 family RNA polymerase sigma factor [Nannocystaceae bacterium]
MEPSVPDTADFDAVYRANYGFVWRTLRHLGVEPARVDDAVQDTFLVVHRRLAEFAGRAALRTWLFQIARRVASHYRRSAAREASRRGSLAEAEAAVSPIGGVEQAEVAELVRIFLAELDHDKAVVFVLAELERWRAPEIADALAINLNTVYSRLRAARKQLDRLVRRLDARERRGAPLLSAALLPLVPPPPPPWHLGPARDPSILSEMVLHAGARAPLRSTLGLAAAGKSTVVGVSLLGAGVAAVLALAPARRSDPTTARPGDATTLGRGARSGVADLEAPSSERAGPERLSDSDALALLSSDAGASAIVPASASSDALAGARSVAPSDALARARSLPPGNARSNNPESTDPHAPASTDPHAPALSDAPASTDPHDAPAPRTSPRRRSAEAPLAAELALMESLRAALLAADADVALQLAERHRRRFPDGLFAEEAAAAAIEARCRLGERERARADAAAFLARWPASALAARVDAQCRS